MTTRRSLLGSAGAAAIGGGLGLYGSTSLAQVESSPSPSLPGASHAEHFTNAVLLTHDGRQVRFYDDLIRGKTVVMNMMYAECEDKCPLATHNLIEVHRLLGDRVGRDVHMYSLTLKPEHDRPAVLKEYVAAHGVPPGWTFLTGDAADLDLIRRRIGFYERDPQRDQDTVRHTNMVRIGNESLSRWVGNAALGKPEFIVNAINAVDPVWQRHGQQAPAAAPAEPAQHQHDHA